MAARAGQINVATAGTAVQGPDVKGSLFALMSNPGNTGSQCWTGNTSGDVTNTNGFPLLKTAYLEIAVTNLNKLYFDVETNGDDICWIRLK